MNGHDGEPDRLGAYRLLDRIGEGGMGVVYLARGPDERAVALKVLRASVASDPNARRRLGREVETMQRVRSPYVAEVIDADLASDSPYIVTRYVPGRTLDDLVNSEGPLAGRIMARLACGLAEALVAVHAAGVVHRDLKPGNVMLVDGAPVVIDFGIAQGPDATRLTLTGMFMGTPGYLAPEVIEGGPSTVASDVHAWGATVAFAATGRPPYGTGSYEGIFYRILNGQPDLAGAPLPILPLLAVALARDPAQRPSATELSAQARLLAPETLVPATAPGGHTAVAGGVGAGTAAMEPAGAGSGGVPGMVGATRADAAAVSAMPAVPAEGVSASGSPGAAAAAAAMAAGGTAVGLPDTISPAAGIPESAMDPPASASGAGLTGLAGGQAVGVDVAGGGPAGGPAVGGNGAVAGGPAVGMDGGALAGGAAMGFGGPFQSATRPLSVGGYAPPDDFSDILPPAQYQPGDAGVAASRPGAASQATSFPFPVAGGGSAAAAARWVPTLVFAMMVVAASVSVILPVAGTLAALTVIALLRASGLIQRRMARRRVARGAKASDPFLALLSLPWSLLRAMLALVLIAPFALAAAALAAGVTVAVAPGDWPGRAVAYGAGMLVLFYGLGPGSSMSRRQLGRAFAAVTGGRTARVIVLAGMTALTAAALTAAVTWPSAYWPAHTAGGFAHAGLSHFRPVPHVGPLPRLRLPHIGLPHIRLPHIGLPHLWLGRRIDELRHLLFGHLRPLRRRWL